jgi:hypothetical protein
MTEQVQKKRYIIKRILDEEDVSKIKNGITKVLNDAIMYYRNLINLVKEPVTKAWENNREEAEKDMFINIDVKHYIEKYVKAYVLSHLLIYKFLPDMVSINITYTKKDKVIVKVIVDKKELSYIVGIARHICQSVELTSFEANDNVTPRKIINKLVNDIDRLIEMYRRDFGNDYAYRSDLEYALNWLRQHGEQVDENKIKLLMETKAKLVNYLYELEDLLKEYRL